MSAGRERKTPVRGFTFLELIVVIAILGIIASLAAPRLIGLVPKYRIRTTARRLGSTLEDLRLTSVHRGLWMGIHYVLTPGSRDSTSQPYYQIIPPAPPESPDLPIEERELFAKEYLPTGVKISRIILASSQAVDSGSINILFSPLGNAGSHIVVLEGEGGRTASLKFNCITGGIDLVENQELAFQHFQE